MAFHAVLSGANFARIIIVIIIMITQHFNDRLLTFFHSQTKRKRKIKGDAKVERVTVTPSPTLARILFARLGHARRQAGTKEETTPLAFAE